MAKMQSINPHDQSVVGEVDSSTQAQVTAAVAKARTAFATWGSLSVQERVEKVRPFRDVLLAHQKELAELTTKEMGKPLQQSMDDVTFELEFIDWYLANAAMALGETVVKETDKATYKVQYEPLGVCAAIAPWNFPVTMASSAIMQQILAGNTVVFKPSEYTTLTQKRFVELMWEAGIPNGVVNIVLGDGDVGKMLVDSDVDLIWFTGSTAVGQEIYAKCGKKFIKGIMELGGSSPGIVFADCNVEHTLDQLYWARYLNCGQVCSAVKRLFVETSFMPTVVAGLKKKLETVRVGDPMTDIDMGPLVSKEQLAILVAQVADAKTKGATVEIGGAQLTGAPYDNGNYFAPTILTNVTKDMRVYTEEVFGPVLVIMPFDTEENAIALANDTPYGLSAELYTNDMDRARRIAKKLQVGTIGVNTDSYYVPFCPIGGYQKSGMGHEYGLEGFCELAQIKYICEAKI